MISKTHIYNEETYQQVVDNIDDVLFIVSPDWKTVYFVSPSYEEVWGKTRESLSEHPLSWTDSLHPDDRKNVFQHIEEGSQGSFNNIAFPDYRIIKPDGSVRWIEARGAPIHNEKGDIYRVVGIAVDITNRKQIEEERENLITSLQCAMDEIGTLRGIVPICSYCKDIRDREGAWHQMEAYITRHTDAAFSHGVCPKCLPTVRSEIDRGYT